MDQTNYLITRIMTLLNYKESTYLQKNLEVTETVSSGMTRVNALTS